MPRGRCGRGGSTIVVPPSASRTCPVSARAPVAEMTCSSAAISPTGSSKVSRTCAGAVFTREPSTGMLLTSTACALAAGTAMAPAAVIPPKAARARTASRRPARPRAAGNLTRAEPLSPGTGR